MANQVKNATLAVTTPTATPHAVLTLFSESPQQLVSRHCNTHISNIFAVFMSKQGYTRQAKGRPLLKCRHMAITHLMRRFWQYDVFSSKGAWHVACGMRILGMWQHAAVWQAV